MIRVLLADDHEIVREGLSVLLDRTGSTDIVANVANGTDALAEALALDPDVAILDVTMPGLSGIEVTHRLHAERPEIRAIILSMHADRQFVVEALRAGARGYVLKENAYNELRKAISTVMRGSVYLSPEVTNLMVDVVVHNTGSAEAAPFDILSTREREVLQLISEGRKTREIAEELFVSQKTVETHRKRIMDKLNLYSVAELTKYSVRHGITDVH